MIPGQSEKSTDGARETQADAHRVLLAVTLAEWGGAQAYVYALARSLQGRYDVCVLCGPGVVLVERLRASAIRVLEVPALRRGIHPLWDLRAFLRIWGLLRRERFDLVHGSSTKAGALVRFAAYLTGVPVILFTAHGWAFTPGRPAPVRALLARWERLMARMTTTVICVSENDRLLAERSRVVARGQAVVIRNGIAPAPFLRPGDEDLRSALNLGAEPVIVMVGRLAQQKAPLTLVHASRSLVRGRVLIAGDGPLRSRVEQAVRRHGLSDRVRLLGFRADIPGLLRASDIFVLPSRWEGLPLAVIEAMMAGLPVVATRVGGVGEVVEDGGTGLLVPPGDPEALAAALRRLVEHEALRRQMGAAGRERALRLFTADRMVGETRALYAALLAARKRG